MTGSIYTWGFGPEAPKKPGFVWLLGIMQRFRIDTTIDLRRPSSQLANPPDPHAVAKLYEHARAGHRILLVCSHADPRRCHRHALLALPIAQDAANYARARAASPGALPIAPIEVWHVMDGMLVDPIELQRAIEEKRQPKGKKWRR